MEVAEGGQRVGVRRGLERVPTAGPPGEDLRFEKAGAGEGVEIAAVEKPASTSAVDLFVPSTQPRRERNLQSGDQPLPQFIPFGEFTLVSAHVAEEAVVELLAGGQQSLGG